MVVECLRGNIIYNNYLVRIHTHLCMNTISLEFFSHLTKLLGNFLGFTRIYVTCYKKCYILWLNS